MAWTGLSVAASGASAVAAKTTGTTAWPGSTASAVTLTPAGSLSNATAAAPPHSARLTLTRVANRPPRGTATVCRSWTLELLPLTLGMPVVVDAAGAVTSMRKK